MMNSVSGGMTFAECFARLHIYRSLTLGRILRLNILQLDDIKFLDHTVVQKASTHGPPSVSCTLSYDLSNMNRTLYKLNIIIL